MKTAVVAVLSAAVLTAGCTDAAVSKAIGSGGDGDAPIVVVSSTSGVTVENHTGRPLLNVRITVDGGPGATFFRLVPTIDTGAKNESLPTDFHTDDGTLLDLAMVHPTQVAVTARDTVATPYAVTIPWTP